MSEKIKFQILLGFAAIYIIWGSTYLAIRLSVETIPPFLMAAIRFIVGGLFFYFWGRLKNREKLTFQHWKSTAIVGLLLLVGGNGLVCWAEEIVPSGIAALLIATVPMWVVIFDWLRPGGSRPKGIIIFSVLFGFIGVGLLLNPTDIGGLSEIDIFGGLLILLASFFWAGGSVYSKYAVKPTSNITSSGMQMIIGGITLILLAFFTGEFQEFHVAEVSNVSWLSLLYLICFGSVGYGAYIWLLKVTEPSKVATYAFVNPVIALLLGNLIASEPISLWTLGCSVIIIIAVIMIIKSKAKNKNKTDRVITAENEVCIDTTK